MLALSMMTPAYSAIFWNMSVVAYGGIAIGFSLMLLVLPRRPALCSWVASMWLFLLAVVLLGRLGDAGEHIIIPLTCGLVCGSFFLLLKGMGLHVGQVVPLWQPLLLIGPFFALIVFSALCLKLDGSGTCLFGAALIVLNVWVIWMLLRHTPVQLRLSYRLAAVVFVLHAVLGVVGLSAGAVGWKVLGMQLTVALQLVSVGLLLALTQCFALVLLIVEQMLADLNTRASIDGLTGLLNRAALVSSGLSRLAESNLRAEPFSVMLVDLDNFKRVNDTWGHLCGDEVLKHFATLATACVVAQPHLIGRYGGEEFVLLLPGMGDEQALALAQQLVQRVREASVQLPAGTLRYTISIGVSSSAPGNSLEHLLGHADAGLYLAKAAGRDQVRVAAAGEFIPPRRLSERPVEIAAGQGGSML